MMKRVRTYFRKLPVPTVWNKRGKRPRSQTFNFTYGLAPNWHELLGLLSTSIQSSYPVRADTNSL